MKLTRIFSLAVSCLVFASTVHTACPEAEAKSLIAADSTFASDADENGVEGWVKHFAPDARMLNSSDEEVVGLEAVVAFYRKAFPTPQSLPKWKPVYADCSADGNLGFTYGTWVGRTGNGSGQYVTVWRKQNGEDWKVIFDLGNKR